MSCWRRIEKINLTNSVRNEEVSHPVKKERNILHTVKRQKTDWIGHILCRNSLLTHYRRNDRKRNRSDGKTRKKT